MIDTIEPDAEAVHLGRVGGELKEQGKSERIVDKMKDERTGSR